MVEEEEEEEEGRAGTTAWMTTFADLMSLLMCFFVLLPSFSELDVAKYKQLSGSMREAFGGQAEEKMKFIPKGTSIITKEFSPVHPNPTAVKSMQQQSTNMRESSLDIRTAPPDESEEWALKVQEAAVAREMLDEKMKQDNDAAIEKLKEQLKRQIELGNIEIEQDDKSITIRIRERGSFRSGSSDLAREFMNTVVPVIQESLVDMHGDISVEGHTDNIPISNRSFSSNWALSSSRALTLGHKLLEDPKIDPNRLKIVGFADTRPVEPNDTWSNRAKNRRVGVVITRNQKLKELDLNLADQGAKPRVQEG